MQLRLIDEAILLLERLEQVRKAGEDGSNPALSFGYEHQVRLRQHRVISRLRGGDKSLKSGLLRNQY